MESDSSIKNETTKEVGELITEVGETMTQVEEATTEATIEATMQLEEATMQVGGDIENVIEEGEVLIKKELLKTLGDFINEIDVAFDYIDRKIVIKLNEFLNEIKVDDDKLTKFVSKTIVDLKPYEANINQITLSNKKIKTSEFMFLSELGICNNILKLDLFADENKNTKRVIIKYLYNIYMSCTILNFTLDDNFSFASLSQELSVFFGNVQDSMKESRVTINEPKASKGKARGASLPSNLDMLGGDLMGSLFANPDIMNMASELSKDIQSQNINPMAMLSSLMSGKPNKKMDDLFSKISGKIEQKLSSGEIDASSLEQQAQSIMNSFENSELKDKIPMLNSILGKKL